MFPHFTAVYSMNPSRIKERKKNISVKMDTKSTTTSAAKETGAYPDLGHGDH